MLLFVFVSMDEALAIHERLNGPVRAALGTGGLFYWAWIIPYGAAAILIALAYIPFFQSTASAHAAVSSSFQPWCFCQARSEWKCSLLPSLSAPVAHVT